MKPCPPSEQLAALLEERLSASEYTLIETHVEDCRACQDVLESLSVNLPGVGWSQLDSPPRTTSLDAPLPFLRDLAQNPPKTADLSAVTFPGPPTAEGPLGQIGPYHVQRALGSGGFGFVFLAFDERLQRRVAIKVLKPELAANEIDRNRFVAEARAAAAVRNEHVVAIHQVETVPDFPLPFLVMDFVEGETLSARLDRDKVLVPHDAAELVRQVAMGLASAHEQGLVHRDVKPANVLLEQGSGRVKVTDFGLARQIAGEATRLTRPGEVPGTPAYMSPEQVLSSTDLDARSDVYGLGVILYELLTGHRPFLGSLHRVLQQTVHDEPVPPRKLNERIPRDLETICLKCLEKSPWRRYANAGELVQRLDLFLAGRPIPDRPINSLERAWRWCRRNSAVACLTAGVFLALTVGAGAATSSAFQADRKAQDERRAREDADRATERANVEVAKRQEAEEEAKRKAKDAGMLAYRFQLQVAQEELARGNSKEARKILVRCDPQFRSWEYYYLSYLCRERALHALEAHEQEVTSVAFSRDGRLIVSGSADKTVRVWNAETGKLEVTFSRHTEPVLTVAIDPTGTRIASGDEGGTIRVWGPATGKEAFTLPGRKTEVSSVAFSPDGKRLASVGADRVVRVWDLAARKEVAALEGHRERVWSVAFSPDGKRLASGGGDHEPNAEFGSSGLRLPSENSRHKVVKVWDAETGKELITLQGHEDAVTSVAFSPDGNYLASGSIDATARIWDVRSGITTHVLRRNPPGVVVLHGQMFEVLAVAFSPDGKSLATGNKDSTLVLWNLASGSVQSVFREDVGGVVALAFRADGKRLVSALNSTVRVWDVEPDQQPIALDPVRGVAESAQFSPGGKSLASGHSNHVLIVWDVATGKQRLSIEDHFWGAHAVAFSPDSKYIASADRLATTVRVWDASTGRKMLDLAVGFPRCVAFSPDGNRLLAGFSNNGPGCVRVWDAATGKVVMDLEAHTGTVNGIAFSTDGKRFATCGDGTVKVWDATTLKVVFSLNGHHQEVSSLAFSPDGKLIASGSRDQTIKIWDLASGKSRAPLLGHKGTVGSVAFSPDGRRLVSGGGGSQQETPEVKLWYVETGHEAITLAAVPDYVTAVMFSPDGNRILASSGDGRIRVWSAAPAR